MKPLGHKNYGSIPHLIGSKTGPGDKTVHEGQHRICTEKVRDRHDVIIVQEKYDGSNVGIAKKDGKIVALTRSGWTAYSSPYHQHHIFAKWVDQNWSLFDDLLNDGERLVGEWLYQAHGTKYTLRHIDPFMAFDLFTPENQRLGYMQFVKRVQGKINWVQGYFSPGQPVSIENAFATIKHWAHYPTCENFEGVIYRVERKGKVDFLAKYVRHDFEPGKFLPEKSGNDPVYNCSLDQFLKKNFIQ